MLIRSVDLPYVCGVKSVLPKTGKPEFVLAGRSNVGKSSFVNALLQRKSFARTSSTPGKTRTINFYAVNDAFFLVDLPGYGYAKRGKKEMEKLRNLIEYYVLERKELTCLFVLIDSRLTPQRIDLEFIQWLGEEGVPFSIIFTKADKNKTGELRKNVNRFLDELRKEWEELPPHFVTSSAQGRGRDEVLDYIDQINAQFHENA